MTYMRNTWGVVLAVILVGTTSSRAARPLTVDDADPVDKGMCQFEAGVGYERDGSSKHWDFPFGIGYGAVQDLELDLALGGQIHREKSIAGVDEKSGIGDLEIGAKWRFLKSSPMGARHALVPTVKLPTASKEQGLGSGKTDFDLTWVVSWVLDDRTGLHYNLGYTWIGGAGHDAIHYGVAMDYQLAEPIQWVGEVFAENETASSPHFMVACNTGLRWNPSDALTIDVAAGGKVHGDTPDISMTIGLTYLPGMD